MESSAVFMELKAMIEKNWLVKSLYEFVQTIEGMENHGKISTEERRFLLNLYLEKFKHGE